MSASSQTTKLSEDCVKLIQQVGKLIKPTDDYMKWGKYLNKSIALIRKYMKSNLKAPNFKRAHFMKLESIYRFSKASRNDLNTAYIF